MGKQGQERWKETAYLGQHVTTQQPVTAVRSHYRSQSTRTVVARLWKMNIFCAATLLLHLMKNIIQGVSFQQEGI